MLFFKKMNKQVLYDNLLIDYLYVLLVLSKLFYEPCLNILKNSLRIWWVIHRICLQTLDFRRYLHCQYISHLGHETTHYFPYGLAKSMEWSLAGKRDPGSGRQWSCLPFLSWNGAFLPDVTAPGARGAVIRDAVVLYDGNVWTAGKESLPQEWSNINNNNHNNNLGFYGSFHRGTKNTLRALTH